MVQCSVHSTSSTNRFWVFVPVTISCYFETMSPTPDEGCPMAGQHTDPTNPDAPVSDDSVVISGMSAQMPGCRALDEFDEKLYNMENLAASQNPRWKCSHPEITPFAGTVPELQRFDAQFFMINYQLSHSTEPMSRKLLEQAYQAIIDAGVSPTELSGKRVGVFIGSGFSEMHRLYYSSSARGFRLLGGSKTMLANRISYWLNAKGPSYTLDASCCSSLVALEMANHAITHGHCDAAIVGAARLLQHPCYSIHYRRLTPLNLDGKTKCYNVNADGQTIAEAITTLFLQKYKDARRVYAEVCHVKSDYAYGQGTDINEEFGFYRDPTKLSTFLRGFYEEAGVSPSDVEYVEGLGAAVPETDKAELQAMEQVFCQDRSQPLLVGNVTSNMGFAGEASGLCGVMKLLLAYRKGELAANLHCDNPRQDILALQDGRMRIVTKHEQFGRSFSALNNFSITGMNAHVLLKGHYKNKNIAHYQCDIPYLVMVSGRQESAVQKIMNHIKANELDPEEIALYHTIHRKRIQKHMARGYGIYESQNQKTVTHCEKTDYFDDARRPLWFVYSGMGSQWAGMGVQLMRIPIFAAAIERCDKVLKPKGVDIVNVITNPDVTVFDNIINSFVGIAAIQIGLTDVLRAMGVVPDHIIGHSVGELGCAYADGCCTTEEMILLSYSRGLISTQTKFIRGSMAAVGIGFKQISKVCPPEIDVACHNGPDSCTISGPEEAMRKFVGELTARGIFAKDVKSSNIAYHSRYITNAGPGLLRTSQELIKEPKLRSERWLSTSVEKDRWHEPAARYSSPEYHTNNMLNPVLFEETLRLVQSGAVLVEVAPHGFLQAILKRSLPADCRHVPLTRRGHPDNVLFLLEALGTLYMEGYDIDLSALYPKIEFPVSTETRQLSHLVEWAHTEEWNTCLYQTPERQYAAIYKPIVTIYDEEYKFLEGSIVEGVRIFPLAGSLMFVWDTLSMLTGKPFRDTSVQFHDVKCYKQPVLKDNQVLRLVAMVQRGSGRFEVTHENMLVVEGRIVAVRTNIDIPSIETEDAMMLNSSDIYKLLFERGYEYKDDFRAIHSSNLTLTKAQIIWRNNWVTFFDGALQFCTLRHDHTAVSQPQYITRICIDVNTHLFELRDAGNMNDTILDAVAFEDRYTVRCGGLSIENISFKDKPLLRQPVVLKTLKFIPFFQDASGDIPTTLYVFMQIVAEHVGKEKLTVLNIDNLNELSVLDQVNSMINGSGIEQIEVIDVKEEDVKKLKMKVDKNPDVIVLKGNCNLNLLETLYHLYPDAFLITIGVNVQDYISSLYIRVSAVGKGLSRLELARWKSKPLSAVALTVARPEDLQCLIVSRTNLQPHQKLVIFTSYPPPSDLKNLVKQWREDVDRNQVYLAMVNEKHRVGMKQLPSFELPYNIFYQDTWGGEYYIPLTNNYTKDRVAALRCSQQGDLNSLYWLQIPKVDQQLGGVKVQVHYAELNCYDAQRELGRIAIKNTQDQGFGMGFSGMTENGKCVMGLMPSSGSVSQQICSSPEFLWPVPAHWSLEDAATVPLAYTIAFYCLGIKSRLVPGTSLLIHGGAGAVGQAAISIALAIGCTVFTTVSDHSKKMFLRNLFPNLPAEHIGNSRDITFKDMVMHHTKGEGCNIVFSCVKGMLKNASLACSSLSGTTFDIVQLHNRENYELGMYCLTYLQHYVTIDVSSIFYNQNTEDFKRIRFMLSEGISGGYVRPLSRVLYAPQDAARAFRLLAASGHRGRVLLRMHDSISNAYPRLSFSRDSCHVLLCSNDGFGINLADRLVQRGVKQLYLHIPIMSNYLLFKRKQWESLGVEVRVDTNVLNSIENVQKLLNEAIVFGQIEGIYLVATDLMTTDTEESINSTVHILDVVSRELCSRLRYFTVISENDSIGRNVCLIRKQCNLNSLSIQLKLKKFADFGGEEDKMNMAMMWQTAVEAIESALLGNENYVVVNLSDQPRDILKEVAIIPGVVVTSDTDESATLREVGLDQGSDQELCTILSEKFNVNIPKEIVPYMTVGQLKNLKMPIIEIDKEVPGFGGYISYIDDDEILASSEVVFMPTLTHTPDMNLDDYEDDETYLCIVPGIEGNHERFRTMCELLKLPALVLQLGLEKYGENIQEIAQRLVDVLMKKLKIHNQFYLLGYEFGVSIVIEMASILESYGLTGTVYCLGGAPNEIRAHLEHKLQGMVEETLQLSLLQHLHYLILGEKTPELEENLREMAEYSDKVRYCVDSLRGRVPHTSHYIETLMEVAYSRIQLMRQCHTEFNVLRAKIIILRANLPKMMLMESWKLSHQDIVIHDLEATLDHAPRDLRCSSLVNKYLGNEILAEFNKRNRCECRIVNIES